MKLSINLARRPFVNDRPLRVATVVATVLVGLASFGNVYLLLDALAESRLVSAREVAERTEAEDAKAEAKRLTSQLTDKEKHRLRNVATSTTGIIRKRALSWSRLFDQLALVLPREVRVIAIAPDAHAQIMNLNMDCVARTNEAKLKYYRKLHEAPFSDAYILGESIEEGKIRFQVRCRYDPDGPDAEPIWEPMPWEPKEDPRKKGSGSAQATAPLPAGTPSGAQARAEVVGAGSGAAATMSPPVAGPGAVSGAGRGLPAAGTTPVTLPAAAGAGGPAPAVATGAVATGAVAPGAAPPGAAAPGAVGAAAAPAGVVAPVVGPPAPAGQAGAIPATPGRVIVPGMPATGLPVVLPPGMPPRGTAGASRTPSGPPLPGTPETPPPDEDAR